MGKQPIRYACARPAFRLFPPEPHVSRRLYPILVHASTSASACLDAQCSMLSIIFGYVDQKDAKTHSTIRQREFSRDHYPNITSRIKVLRRQYVRVVPYKIHPHCFGELEPLSVKIVAARGRNIHWVDRVVTISVEVVVPRHSCVFRGVCHVKEERTNYNYTNN